MAKKPEVEKQQFNIYLPPGLIRELKIHCVEEGKRLSHKVEEIFREYLKKQKKRKDK